MRLYTINPRKSRELQAPVATITASSGRVSVLQSEDRVPATTLEQGETLECKNRAGFTVTAIGGGAKIGVVFAGEAAPAKRPAKPKRKAASSGRRG